MLAFNPTTIERGIRKLDPSTGHSLDADGLQHSNSLDPRSSLVNHRRSLVGDPVNDEKQISDALQSAAAAAAAAAAKAVSDALNPAPKTPPPPPPGILGLSTTELVIGGIVVVAAGVLLVVALRK